MALVTNPGELRWFITLTFKNTRGESKWEHYGDAGKTAAGPLELPEDDVYKIGLDVRWERPPYNYSKWHIPLPKGFNSSETTPTLYKTPNKTVAINFKKENLRDGPKSPKTSRGYGGILPFLKARMKRSTPPYKMKISPLYNNEPLFNLEYYINAIPEADEELCWL